MDHPRNAAQKIRPILQAMERSIDSARRRRTNEPDVVPANGLSAMSPTASAMQPSASASMNRGINPLTSHAQTHAQRQAALDQTRIGGGHPTPAPINNPAGVIRPGDVHQPAAQNPNHGGLQPNLPPRLKAKPKPASPFLNELDPPAYRQQAS